MIHNFPLRFIWLFVLCMMVQSPSFSQGNMLTLEDAVLNTRLNPQSIKNPGFLPSGNYFSYLNPSATTLYIERIDKMYVDSLPIQEFKSWISSDKGKDIPSFPPIKKWISDTAFLFEYAKKIYVYSRVSQRAWEFNQYPDNYDDIEWNNDFTACAFTRDYQLYLQKRGEKERKITEDGQYGISYGKAAHRHEFGINKGLFWNHKNNMFLFYRIDERDVTDYYLFDNQHIPATVRPIKYPFAGKKNQIVTVGIYDVLRGQIHYLKTGSPADQYLTNLAWSPNDAFVYLTKVSRNQKNMWLERYWVSDGSIDKVLSEEFNEKYVEPENPPTFVPWDQDQYVLHSQKDGYNHLYLYNQNGKLLRKLTTGPWVVKEIVGFHHSGEQILVTGTKDSPLENHLYAISLKNAKITKLTNEGGYHRIVTNHNGSYFLDLFSSITVPSKALLLSESGAILRKIHDAVNPLKDYALGETRIFPLSVDRHTLYARMTTPVNFDPKKQYPVLVYVYGGPHVQLVKNNWLGGSNLWMQYMAQQGFIVFTLDNRGSANRGFDFESAIFKELGKVEMEDQLAGVDYLKSLPYVDISRIGIHGWSFGGFMTTSLVSRAPDVFKMGVAGGPVIDWKMYEIMYTERYMETPESNPDGYERSNLLNYTKKLDVPLLLLHGCDDDVVLWQHSLLYVEKAVKYDKTSLDYFVYPGHKHNIYGKDRLHLMSKITAFIFDKL